MFYRLIINFLITLNAYKLCESSYTSVRKTGSNYNNSETIINYKPEIVETNGMLPKVLHNSESVPNKDNNFIENITKILNESATESISTGRAIYYTRPDIISNLRKLPELYFKERQQNQKLYPVYKHDQPKIILPVKNSKAFATDRFTPGEAVATELFKNKKKNVPSNNRRPMPQASQTKNTYYIPPKNIYNFPPNLESNYPGPKPYSSSPVSSYIPPPAGPVEKETDVPKNQYLGPLSPEYLPYESKNNNNTDEKRMVMPEMMSDSGKDNKDMPDMDDHKMEDAEPEHDTPPPDSYDSHDAHEIYSHDSHDIPSSHDSHEIHSHDSHEIHSHHPHEIHSHDPHEYHSHGPPDIHDISYPIHHKPNDHNPQFFDYHNFDSHPIKYNGPWNPWNNVYSSYPDIIYDHDHDHFHHHKEVTTTAPEPPPPPPPEPEEPHTEPRVKKYSYFYLGRKLWYIPLYFTVWFSFYVLWLIVKSIARHKVNLPNHYVARDLHKRHLFDSLDEHKYKNIDQLTNFVMKSIEKYQ